MVNKVTPSADERVGVLLPGPVHRPLDLSSRRVPRLGDQVLEQIGSCVGTRERWRRCARCRRAWRRSAGVRLTPMPPIRIGILRTGERHQLGQPVLDAREAVLEQVHPGLDRAEVVSVDGVILFVPARAEAENQPASADVVDGAGHVGQQVGIAVADPGDQQPDVGVAGDLGPRRQRGPPFEVVRRRAARAATAAGRPPTARRTACGSGRSRRSRRRRVRRRSAPLRARFGSRVYRRAKAGRRRGSGWSCVLLS